MHDIVYRLSTTTKKHTKIDLRAGLFLARGGQGSIYECGGSIYKIYHDPLEMIPLSKFEELQVLQRSNIIKPEDLILDADGKRIGFVMKKAEGFPLCRLFVSSFKDDNNITDDVLNRFFELIRDTIKYIHSNKCLQIDGNELSYVIDKYLKTVYFIDVDSYYTPSHRDLTYIKMAVKDFHTKGYSELTDWFTFAVVMCWMYLGIHPFKGRHPKFKTKGPDALKNRMLANVSIFHKDVRAKDTVFQNMERIPTNYRDWFIDLFEKGKRTPPPGLPGTIKQVVPKSWNVQSSTENFNITFYKDFEGNIIHFSKQLGVEIVKTKSDGGYNLYIDSKFESRKDNKTKEYVVIEPFSMKYITIQQSLGEPKWIGVLHDTLSIGSNMCDMCLYENSVYVVSRGLLREVQIKQFSNSSIESVYPTRINIMENSTLYDGFLSSIGLRRTILYFPVPGHGFTVKIIPELDNYTIINGKYDHGVCQIVAKKDDTYDKLIIRITKDGTYDIRIINNVDIDSINFVTLDNGICASFSDEHTIELFRNKPGLQDIRSITDNNIDLSMRLWKDGNRLLYSKGNNLYIIKTKRK